jgi:hypothetical protein
MKKKIMLVAIAVAAAIGGGSTASASEKSTADYFSCGATLGIQGRYTIDLPDFVSTDYKLALQIFNLKFIKALNKGKIAGCIKVGMGGKSPNLSYSYPNLNVELANDIYITFAELFCEYPLSVLGQKFTLDFGKLSLSGTFARNNYTSDFTTKSFTTDELIPKDFGPALKLNCSLTDEIDIDCAHFINCENEAINACLSILQITYKPSSYNFLKNGNYRAYIWIGNRFYNYNCPLDSKYKDVCNDYDTSKIYGIGISLDKKINEYFGSFVKLAYKNPAFDTHPPSTTKPKIFSLAWNAGLQATLPRNSGSIGFAVGQFYVSSIYAECDEFYSASPETQLELYYKLTLDDNIILSTSIQYIGNKALEERDITITCGIKINIKF